MAVLPVRVLPDRVLKAPTHAVETLTPSVQRLIDDLIDTMRHHPRCVGLAATQVGSSLRVAVIDVTGHPKAAASHGLLVCVNPRIVEREGETINREGCLSIPDFTGNVRRANRVLLEAMDEAGARWTYWLEGFEAIAAQHEVDHLDGLLFLDRVANLKADLFRRKTYWFPDTKRKD